MGWTTDWPAFRNIFQANRFIEVDRVKTFLYYGTGKIFFCRKICKVSGQNAGKTIAVPKFTKTEMRFVKLETNLEEMEKDRFG